jgi:hypothetical protein
VSSQNAESSVMGVYLKHVHARLHSETIGTASRSGSSEPWLLNLLQEQCSTKKGSNLSDYKSTLEHFGTVPIHSKELGEAINQIKEPVRPISLVALSRSRSRSRSRSCDPCRCSVSLVF